ncbi:type II toxin-antitoxin system VapC family toxin [Dietzia timorensis]|uniref:Ribonuclease VapC n=1 Tax=Dietzia timorensis TaxID=499555 RepID=A0A173LJU9_9ACTN|nr:type II toxin-antitoxin system VapC family toxin [Dietzia timorensis]ANI91731.1 putative VapC ribonuclease [Dietzia timorensis]
MIIDTSAMVSILRGENDAGVLLDVVSGARQRNVSAASILELTIVLSDPTDSLIDDFLDDAKIVVLDVDTDHLRWARHAHRIYGRGSGSPAKLNFGDCLVYGAAKATASPLLYKGNDFSHTDVRPAVRVR